MRIKKWAPARLRPASLAVLAGALVLSACSEAGSGELLVGYSPKFLKDDFMVVLQEQVKKSFSEANYDLMASDPNGDVTKQVNDLQNMIANGAQALVFAPLDGAGIVPVIKRANEAGIPVFSIDDAPQGGKVAATVRADNVDAGAQGAEEMVNRLKEAPCWPSDCTVLELQGSLASANGRDRSKGFSETLRELAPDVKLIQRPTEWTAEKAADATQNILTQTRSLSGVFMASELMLSAVNARLQAAGRGAPVGDAESVIRVAIDGTPEGLEGIRGKKLDATVSQPLTGYASTVTDLIKLVTEGGTLEVGEKPDGRVVDTPVGPEYQLTATLVTAENVDDPDLWGNKVG